MATTKKKQSGVGLNIRIPDDTNADLRRCAAIETKRTGIYHSVSALVRRAIAAEIKRIKGAQ